MSVEGIYPVQLTGVKVTLLKCGGKLILVDTGRRPEDADAILDYARTSIKMPLEKYGEVCVLTHSHGDHIGGLKRLKEKCNIKIASHIDEAPAIESATGLKVDLKLKDRESLPNCGGIQFIHVPGHTVGNVCLYLKEKALLIVGDTVFGDEAGNLSAPPDRYCKDPEMAKRELKRLGALDFDCIIVSHGKDVEKGAKEKLKRIQT